MFPKKKRLVQSIGVVSALALGVFTLTACSSSEEASSGGEDAASGGISETITVGMVNDQTGAVAYAGVGAREGAELAIEEINSQGFLGEGVTMELKVADAGGEIERASSEMTKMMGDSSVPVIIGPAASQQAAAVAPLVERQQVPTVFTQSGSEGVVIGDWTFRATAPMESYYDAGIEWLADQGYKKLNVLYNGQLPTFAQLGGTIVPELAAENGLEITDTQEVQTSTQDFTNQAQKIAASNPDAVVMLVITPQAVTMLKQLREAGYEGQVIAATPQANGSVAEAGTAAEGLVYPVDFSASFTNDVATKLVETYTAEFDKSPSTYVADGYDAIWWIARAIKESDSSTREGIKDGLVAVGEQGFEGAGGTLTFEDGHDMRVEGEVAQWTGDAEVLVD